MTSYWQKYEGRYDEGYEVLKSNRLRSLRAAGMIPENAGLPPNHESVKPWDSLSVGEKRIESRKMELYAGMVDNLDHNVGRIINHLKNTRQYDNTLIVFMADNGAAAEDFYDHDHYGPFLQEHFTNTFENMGAANSFFSYGPQWAEAGTAPFRYFKGLTTEGGIIAPLIIAGPGIERKQEIHHGFLTLMDLAPTFYEIAKATYAETFEGRKVYPLRGKSLIPFLTRKTDQIHSPDYVFGLEHNNYAMIRKGEWKITNIAKPFNEENFKLYNLEKDLAELHDLKAAEPEKYKELMEEWYAFSTEIAIQIPVPSRDLSE